MEKDQRRRLLFPYFVVRPGASDIVPPGARNSTPACGIGSEPKRPGGARPNWRKDGRSGLVPGRRLPRACLHRCAKTEERPRGWRGSGNAGGRSVRRATGFGVRVVREPGPRPGRMSDRVRIDGRVRPPVGHNDESRRPRIGPELGVGRAREPAHPARSRHGRRPARRPAGRAALRLGAKPCRTPPCPGRDHDGNLAQTAQPSR